MPQDGTDVGHSKKTSRGMAGKIRAPDLKLGIRNSAINTKPLALPRALLSQVSQQCDQW